MTRKEAIRQTEQANRLADLGFTLAEADQLRRISLTLHRWHERECGSDSACIVRGRQERGGFVYDDEGQAYEEIAGLSGPNRYRRIPDRETGAKQRLASILGQRNGRPAIVAGRLNAAPAGSLRAYIQTDPRGAALYLLRPGDVPEGGEDAAYYTRGICVY